MTIGQTFEAGLNTLKAGFALAVPASDAMLRKIAGEASQPTLRHRRHAMHRA